MVLVLSHLVMVAIMTMTPIHMQNHGSGLTVVGMVSSLDIALILLGLGWNFGLISGTAIIIDSTDMKTRAKTQGSVDVWVALAGTAGSILSGIIVAYASYAVLGLLGMFLSLLLIPLIIWKCFKDSKK